MTETMEGGTAERGTGRTERLELLFGEYLDAADAGRDVADELLARAGELRADLEAKIALERELHSLSRELGLGSRTPDARQLLGRFHILGTLGRGGISRVYLAYDPKLERRIALKVLDREALLDKDQRYWILNEARSLARIRHRGVVEVFEVDETETHAFVAMELLSGPSLADVLRELARQREGGGGEPAEAVRVLAARLAAWPARVELLAALAEALAECHDHGIFHRDIKPQNVLFDNEGWPKLIDFGLAHLEGADEDSRLGLTQTLVGTAAYTAPEQVASDQTGADPRSDQFSFGTLAYECLALENPFLRKTRRATLDAIEAADPPRLGTRIAGLPPDLALVIHHALEREPAARYPVMAALAADLRAVLEHRPVQVREASLAHVARLWLRRHRRGVTVATGALLTALLFWVLTGILGAWRERGAILAALAEIRPETFANAEGFVRTSAPLAELHRRARELDTGIWARAALPGTSTEVQATIESWSRSLAEDFAREAALGAASGIPVQDEVYRSLFWQEADLCPACPFNAENRKRGRVLVPDWVRAQGHALDVLCFEASIMGALVSVFRPAPLVELLVSGTYRLQVWEEGADSLSHEVVFYVPPGWNPALSIGLHPPRPELLERTLLVERGLHTFPGGERLTVARFRIAEKLVTAAEFEKFRAATGHPVAAEFEETEADEAARVPFSSAVAYCQWAGGRLPMLHELLVAREKGVSLTRTRGGTEVRELVLDIGPDGRPIMVGLPAGAPPAIGMAQRDILMTSDGQTPGFRLVFTADSPAFLRERAEHPIER